MNHPWPPNDLERADWDRRAAAFEQRIATLEADLIASQADVLVAREQAETLKTKANAAREALAEAAARAAELRRVVEFYASGETDKGKQARAAL